MPSVEEVLLAQIKEQVLDPLEDSCGDEEGVSEELYELVKMEMKRSPIITFMTAVARYDEDVTERDAATGQEKARKVWHDGIVEYKLGEESPIDSTRTVFAMFLWETLGVVCVYSMQMVDVAGKTGRRFFREVVKNWSFLDCQMSGHATITQLKWMLEPPDDGDDPQPKPPEKTNGAHA